MERRRLGRTDMEVSALGFGGSEIGYDGVSQAVATRLLNAALDAGLNVIDTAECYADSETLIGRAVSDRRREFHLFTKVGHARGWSSEDWSPASILESIERSLTRLRTDRLDLVQLHSCGLRELRRGECIGALETAKQRGLTRYIGYSGDGAAAKHAVECGRFDTLQISVNVADQEALDGAVALARERRMGVIAKRPLANAIWASRRRPGAYYVDYWERLRALEYEFTGRPMDEAVGVALRFTLSVPGVHTAIVGTTKPGRWKENAARLAAGPLPRAEFEAIRARWRERSRKSWTGQV
ncbi:MAG TPA: aldo/keto reductase [Methylomirabilota bacterium]|jgi:aryl-alcohol dehydrogenase-like predicted oxidoreductase|nr:aldo/keto reductase [Methylomirabilota bacterium]